MKIVFYSNYLNHHQLPICKEFLKIANGDFYFVSQKAISEKRIALGYKNIAEDYDFNIKTYKTNEELNKAYELANEADFVIFGSSSNSYIENRIKNNKITFKASERLFKFKSNRIGFLREFRRVYLNHGRYKNKNLYMLCEGSYAAYDFIKYGAYKNKTYKWGYFPETYSYDINQLMDRKQHKITKMLWVGRFIDWKHPEIVIRLAKKLKEDGYLFTLNIVGQGEMESEIESLINKYNLENYVKILGSMSPEKVREYMLDSNIFVFTSDYSEGWGAVLNEAMNSGCACIVSHAIGSAGYLIKHMQNGLIYDNDDFCDLYDKTKFLLDNKKEAETYGKNAYYTIVNEWNAKEAANRLVVLYKHICNNQDTPFISGPCSMAKPIKEKDMYNYLVNRK